MTEEIVIDANVPAVANGITPQAADACLRNCVAELRRVQSECQLLIDDKWRIITEYLGISNLTDGNGLGDAFVKWVLNNQMNEAHVRRITITPEPDRGFEEYPDDDDPVLSSFDPGDRKFVDVAFASGTFPDIVNATDTDWWAPRHALQQHDVNVRFLCPDLMTRG